MSDRLISIGDCCKVTTGILLSRARALDENDKRQVHCFTPKSMENGSIVDEEITCETISHVKESFFSREGDVLVKSLTPYDCVYVGKEHAGILVPSFAFILRAKPDSTIDMRFLTAYLNQPQTKKLIEANCAGSTLKSLKKHRFLELIIPLVSAEEQSKIAELYLRAEALKKQCLKTVQLTNQLLGAEFDQVIFN